jgi:uncharacterized protein YndB with AHSA1/START domain
MSKEKIYVFNICFVVKNFYISQNFGNMPSKKTKVSSIKNKKKPIKASTPATKKLIAKKKPLTPVKSKKPAKPIPAKKSSAKKIIKAKPVPAKKVTVAKKVPAKKTLPVKNKLVTKALVKKVLTPAKANGTAKKVEPSKKEVSKKSVTPIPAQKIKLPEPKIANHKPVAKEVAKAPAKTEEISKFEKGEVFKKAEKPTYDVLAISNTIPVKQQNTISASKIASISNSITNPVKKTDSYAVKPEKEPNGKYEMEFVVHSSAEMLYEFLSTPSGLSEWFCDDLNIRNGIYTFIWDDQLQQARLLKTVDLQLVRFQWVDKTDGSFFEFKIQRDDLTNDIALIITDFADSVSDRESSKLLWNSQIEKLMHVIGSIF